MSNAFENAKKRLVDIKLEMAQIEEFLALYRRFDPLLAEATGLIEPATDVGEPVKEAGPTAPEGFSSPQEAAQEFQRRTTPEARLEQMVSFVQTIIRKEGRPMNAPQIVRAMEENGVGVPAGDKNRFVAAIISRYRAQFVRTGSNEFWLRGAPLASPKPIVWYEPDEVHYSDAV
jgi:hypothetical protein